MKKSIDARKLPCPQPLILAKKELESGKWDEVEITVDNQAARENLEKYARFSGAGIWVTEKENGDRIVTLSAGNSGGTAVPGPAGQPAAVPAEGPAGMPSGGARQTVFIRTDALGAANRELGLLLMRGFVYTLTELETKPRELILMNDGVRLAVEGSDSLENLQKLESSGVRILVCGTCLDYLGLKENLKAGKISNMYEIIECFMQSPGVLTV